MLNRLLKTKLPYTSNEESLIKNYNFTAKIINSELSGEKLNLISDESQVPDALFHMIKSLNGRNILKKKLKYSSDYIDCLNFAVNALNSSTE
jgi:hypothetical protein